MSTKAIPPCPRCGGEVPQTPRGRQRTYCSDTCGHVRKTCPECLDSFTAPQVQQFCGNTCRGIAMGRRNASDPAAQAARGRRGGAVMGDRLRGTGNGYRKQNGRHEHRAIAEEVLGRSLLPGEVVHHEDLDKQNNTPSNLIVFPSQADHARHHKLGHCLTPCNCPGIRLGEVMPR